jgi:multiple sugar transport system ATP-binding protein
VSIGERVVNHVPARDRDIAMVFQSYALYPHLTVYDNIAFGLRLRKTAKSVIAERVAWAAKMLDLTPYLERRPKQLSGGQRQRVAMGRAIVRRPRLFLMDEPLSNLDSGLRAELRAEISSLVRELGVSTIYVTHDQAEALTMADRVAILRDGVLQDVGTPTQVYNRPATLYVAAFLGSPRMNLLEAKVYVELDRYVVLSLGEQALYLPWDDIRGRVVAHYHGERIVIGMRPEALTPVAPGQGGDRLVGKIRFLEHHGHETLAFIDVGATAIMLEDLGGTAPVSPAVAGNGRLPRFGKLLNRLRRPAEASAPDPAADNRPTTVFYDPGRHHRRPAELAVRLAPYPQITPGQSLSVAVRLEALHFFDERGDRIDVGYR